MRKRRKNKKSVYLYFLLIFFVFYAIFFIFKSIKSSVFFKGKERINIFFYGEKNLFYSLGKDLNYFFSLPSGIKVLTPGGYGYYRLGGLGKLVFLEKKPEIFKKTSSLVTSSFVDLYFYPPQQNIYYGKEKTSGFVLPTFNQIFFYKTNGNFIDRILLSVFLLRRNSNNFKIISYIPLVKKGNEAFFDDEKFFEIYQGLFYKKTYRDLKDNVQIIYTKSYKTAILLSRIIEGEGIRVVDISYKRKFDINWQNLTKCLVIENKKNPSLITQDLKNYFGCQFVQKETDLSDIILVLENLENEWQID